MRCIAAKRLAGLRISGRVQFVTFARCVNANEQATRSRKVRLTLKWFSQIFGCCVHDLRLRERSQEAFVPQRYHHSKERYRTLLPARGESQPVQPNLELS